MAEINDFTLKIITPDRIFYEKPVKMVEFNTVEGEIGVLPGHIPMTVIVKPGVLTITEEDGSKEAALHAGFAEILQNQVTRAQEAKERAEERLRTKEPETDTARAEIALRRALTRIEVLK